MMGVNVSLRRFLRKAGGNFDVECGYLQIKCVVPRCTCSF